MSARGRMPTARAPPPRRALEAAEARRAEAEQGRAAAAEARDAAESELAAARAALSAARSEHDALARALEHGGGSAIASLKAAPGYERALAAALGEDSEAAIGGDGPRRWQGSEPQSGDPSLPAGSRMPGRSCHGARASLLRRLRQVAVVDEDCGQRSRSASGWSRATAGCAAGTASSRSARARPRPSGCFASTGWPQLAAELAGAATSAAERAQSATRTISRDGAAAAGRRRGAGAPALAAEREARDAGRASTRRRPRSNGSQLSARPRATPCRPGAGVDAARESVAAAEQALAALPDPARWRAKSKRARTPRLGRVSRCRQARGGRDPGAGDAAARDVCAPRRGNRGDWRTRLADAERRLDEGKDRQAQQAAERSRACRRAAGSRRRIARPRARQFRKPGARSARRQPRSTTPSARSTAAAVTVSAANERSAGARERRAGALARAESQQARSTELASACVERFECVPQRLPERLGFDPAEVRNAAEESARSNV